MELFVRERVEDSTSNTGFRTRQCARQIAISVGEERCIDLKSCSVIFEGRELQVGMYMVTCSTEVMRLSIIYSEYGRRLMFKTIDEQSMYQR